MLCTVSFSFAQNENYSKVHASFNFGGTDIERTGLLNHPIVNAVLNQYVSGIDKINTIGFSAGYTYGINIDKSLPLFVEVGGELNYVGGTSTIFVTHPKSLYCTHAKLGMMNMQVPVNVTYNIPVVEGLDIAPFAGVDFKLNLMGNMNVEDEGCNLFDGDDVSRLCYTYIGKIIPVKKDIDATANRFQMGLNLGVNFIIAKKYSIGYRFMTDITRYYSLNEEVGILKQYFKNNEILKQYFKNNEIDFNAGVKIKPTNYHYITFGYIF